MIDEKSFTKENVQKVFDKIQSEMVEKTKEDKLYTYAVLTAQKLV
jgi:hypothetical protein